MFNILLNINIECNINLVAFSDLNTNMANANCRKVRKNMGNAFVVLIHFVILLVIYNYTITWVPEFHNNPIKSVILLSIFYFFGVMLLWSFYQAESRFTGYILTQGFHMGDSEQKRRRYCLMCNVFKPERCHHCSTCNRCVLNMDHHCPWVNNCIGFWNRKPFLLLILYVLCILYFYIITMSYKAYQSVMYIAKIQLNNIDIAELALNAYYIGIYCFLTFLSAMLSIFFKFHILLVIKNITTLESLEKKGTNFDSPFDIGKRKNWEQVFGLNPRLWLFPVNCSSGKPWGNGVNWPLKVSNTNEFKMMNYEDNTQPDETAEYEIKKSSSLAKNAPQGHGDPRNNNVLKSPVQHEADYHENIKKPKAQPKKIHPKAKTTHVEATNKVEVSEDMLDTKKITFKQKEVNQH